MTTRSWRLLAWLSTAGVLVMCFVPGSGVPQHEVFKSDKLFHVLAFLIVAYCWRRSGLTSAKALLVGILLALGTEIGQELIGMGRQGDVLDVLADSIGTVLGVAIAACLAPARRAPGQAPSEEA